jgi:hypothetical protein
MNQKKGRETRNYRTETHLRSDEEDRNSVLLFVGESNAAASELSPARCKGDRSQEREGSPTSRRKEFQQTDEGGGAAK